MWIVGGGIDKIYSGKDVNYIGLLDDEGLGRMYKLCDALIHMVYLDACSNSVVEASVAGCHVICGNQGGTIELVGFGGKEKEYDFKPINLNKPPKINTRILTETLHMVTPNRAFRFSKQPIENKYLHISNIAEQYEKFFRKVLG